MTTEMLQDDLPMWPPAAINSCSMHQERCYMGMIYLMVTLKYKGCEYKTTR